MRLSVTLLSILQVVPKPSVRQSKQRKNSAFSTGNRLLGRLLIYLQCCTVIASAQIAQAVLPHQEDARLLDVQFLGQQLGWAVGDHGVIWKTSDGGVSWNLQSSPVSCSLRCVSFITNDIGWVAGGKTQPHTGQGLGVLLFTEDGGTTWQELARHQLPQLNHVRFFNLEEGIVAGEASAVHPSGVLVTRDKGKTWNAVPGAATSGWLTAEFLNAQAGVVAGHRSQLALYGAGQLLKPRLPAQGLRGYRDVALQEDKTGWIVGDGALVQVTSNGGVSWQSPPTPLPADLRDIVDFKAVAQQGDAIWIAGSPGSVIWHSPDRGRSWYRQSTGNPTPINALHFSSATDGWAVGEFGLILRTSDGGRTWQSNGKANRRAAVLNVAAKAEQISLPVLAKLSAAEGYRSAVWIPARSNQHNACAQEFRLAEALSLVQGSVGTYDWRFPVDRPDIERDVNRLRQRWMSITEGRLKDAFLRKLVTQIRMFRPALVILQEPGSQDALEQFIYQAAKASVPIAADPTQYIDLVEQLDLQPWKVQKVYTHMPAGSRVHAVIDLNEYLPRLQTTANLAARPAMSLLQQSPQISAQHPDSQLESYRQIDLENSSRQQTHFFAGLILVPGSAARRELPRVDGSLSASRKKILLRQKVVQNYMNGTEDQPREASQLIAHLDRIHQGMPPNEAAESLLQLANQYRQHAQWELAESVLVRLVQKHPDQPAAHAAMRWLTKNWIGVEPTYQRLRQYSVSGGRERISPRIHPGDYLEEPLSKKYAFPLMERLSDNIDTTDLPPADNAIQQTAGTGHVMAGTNVSQELQRLRSWQQRALVLQKIMEKHAPELLRLPDVQLPLSSLKRNPGHLLVTEPHYRPFLQTDTETDWQRTVAAEMWLENPVTMPPKPVISCKRAGQPPVLDAVLSEPCWQNAHAIRLKSGTDEPDRTAALLMVSYDQNYLYLAASVPRRNDVRWQPPDPNNREHDADLRGQDRLVLHFDLDRDYATYYTFQIDQRGWTSEACWEDYRYNPQWFVASQADQNAWRIEAAIPIKEMAPNPPQAKRYWAVGLKRIMPAVGVQSWMQPAEERPRPELFGLMRFD